jgi:hypothetical protein
MSMPRILAGSVLAFALAARMASAQDAGLGKPLTESDIKNGISRFCRTVPICRRAAARRRRAPRFLRRSARPATATPPKAASRPIGRR